MWGPRTVVGSRAVFPAVPEHGVEFRLHTVTQGGILGEIYLVVKSLGKLAEGGNAETREKALKDWTAQYQSKKDELDKKEHQLMEEIHKAQASITSCTAEITRLDDQYKTDLATLKAKYGF